jgi:hypothetical protein
MKSPMTKGLSMTIDSEAKRSPRMFCMARATAIPPMPSPATRVVILIPRLSRVRRMTTDQRTSLKMKLKAEYLERSSPASFLRVRARPTANSKTAAPQIAPWKMMAKITSLVRMLTAAAGSTRSLEPR